MFCPVMHQCFFRHFASAAGSPYSPRGQVKGQLRGRSVTQYNQVTDGAAAKISCGNTLQKIFVVKGPEY